MNAYEKKKNKPFFPILSLPAPPPLLLLDNVRKFLLPFLHAIVNLCRNSKGLIGYLLYELKRAFPEELQSEIWNPTVRKISMQHLTKLNMYLLLGLKAAAVTMKRISKSALLLPAVSIHAWPGVNSGFRTPIWLSALCKLLSYCCFFFSWQLKNFNYTRSNVLYTYWGKQFLFCFLSHGLL